MGPLQPPDSHCLTAAHGWFKLGDLLAAEQELVGLSEAGRLHPSVLELSWQIHAAACDWHVCLEIADLLIQHAPNDKAGWLHRSFTLNELHRTQEALDTLKPLAQRHPEDPLIAYNLACYACRAGHLDQAWHWLSAASKTSAPAKLCHLAGQDPDLRPLWPELGRLCPPRPAPPP